MLWHTLIWLGCHLQDKRGMIEMMKKTRLCEEFMNTGSCRYGDKCTFAHGRHELRSAPQMNQNQRNDQVLFLLYTWFHLIRCSLNACFLERRHYVMQMVQGLLCCQASRLFMFCGMHSLLTQSDWMRSSISLLYLLLWMVHCLFHAVFIHVHATRCIYLVATSPSAGVF